MSSDFSSQVEICECVDSRNRTHALADFWRDKVKKACKLKDVFSLSNKSFCEPLDLILLDGLYLSRPF